MKKLLLIAILSLVGCSTDEIESGEQRDCNCGIVIYKAYRPDGSVILRIKNDCDNQVTELEFPQNVSYNLNDTYCYGM
jgi:hypothetical protein